MLLRPGAVALALCLFAAPALAQDPGGEPGGPPGIDHYKVYRLLPPITALNPVILRDQYVQEPHVAQIFEYFATPAVKNGFPLFDPILHYNWWRIDPRPIAGTVLATNQFGPDQALQLIESSFLLNPSLKFPDPTQQLPDRNHYKCYRVDGLSPERLVTIQDQFGFNEAIVQKPEFFCTPTEKTTQEGVNWPIRNSEAHLVCYRIVKTPPTPPQTIVTRDQFGFWQAQLAEAEFLCVPTFKTGTTPAVPQSWGGVKSIYR
jgi:hypothetical protein